MTLVRQLILALLLALVPGAAHAEVRNFWIPETTERILNFVSDVRIEPDGDLEVTETIRLVALNRTINRGILRDFPTSYRDRLGRTTRVGFTVLSVERNGQSEPWETSGLSNGVRIRIGSPDVILPIGEHTYTIRYRTTRQIHYGEDSDELYWNATGTGWTFPIEQAEARITLPGDAPFGNRAFYTGPDGSTMSHAEVIEERPGYIAFRTTRPLWAYEGLTVAASFPKGVLEAPGAGRRLSWWLSDWGAFGMAILASLGVVGYYFHAWRKAGRNPRAGTIVPIFSPPDGLSPAAMRYIMRMGFDDRAYSAAMVDLGVRGKLHIAQEKGGLLSKSETTLTRTDIDRFGDGRILPGPEAAMYDRLFSLGDTLELKQEHHTVLSAARTALENGLAKAYENVTFRKNSMWAVAGLVMIPLAMFISALAALIASPQAGLGWIGIPLGALFFLAVAWATGSIAAERQKGCLSALLWLMAVAAGFAAVASGMVAIATALEYGAYAVLIPLLLLPLAVSALWWMYAPTPEGRQTMDRIAGFRRYLSITEESRLDTLHPPEKTPELFERYLPYAIALDVENRWADRFAGVLATAAAAGATAHAASWYSGSGNAWDDPAGFASNLGSSFTSTVSSASTAPGSSGGSSGGGSSGGGGGGGGGSGW